MKKWLFLLLLLSVLARRSLTQIPPAQLTLIPYNLGLQVKILWQPAWTFFDYRLERWDAGSSRWQPLAVLKPGECLDYQVQPGHTYRYRLSYNWLWFTGSLENTISVPDQLSQSRQHFLQQLQEHYFPNPTVNKVQQRWIYDDALGVIIYSLTGDQPRARALLQRLQSLQRKDGSLNFFYFSDGQKSETYIRNGAIAWTGYAAVIYQRQFADREFFPFAEGIAGYLLSSRADNGLITGGYGTYSRTGSYQKGRVSWASTEHNLDAYFFFKELGQVSGNSNYKQIARQLAEAIDRQLWQEPEGWLKTGTSENQPALDTLTWGGLFYLSIGQPDKARRSSAHLERFALPQGYSETAGGPLWLEGSWGAACLRLRLGEDISHLLKELLLATEKEKARTSDLAWAYLVLSNPEFFLK